MRCAVLRHVHAVSGLSLTMAVLAACSAESPTPAGFGGVVGHMSGTSDVEGQPGESSVGGGGLALIAISAMDGPFWLLTAQEPLANPEDWAYLSSPLSEGDVEELGGTVAHIDDGGNFRPGAVPGRYIVCYWPDDVGGRVTGCDAIELPADGVLEATWGEAGFDIRVAG